MAGSQETVVDGAKGASAGSNPTNSEKTNSEMNPPTEPVSEPSGDESEVGVKCDLLQVLQLPWNPKVCAGFCTRNLYIDHTHTLSKVNNLLMLFRIVNHINIAMFDI